jgi:fumarate hydratase, class I
VKFWRGSAVFCLLAQDGIFLEQLETDVGKYLPEVTDKDLGKDVVKVDLNKPMAEIRSTLSKFPVRTRLSLTGQYAAL